MATDVIARGMASSASAKVGEQISSHFRSGSNIQIVDNPDGTQTINASGEVSAEDTVARAEIADIKDGETLDSFGDVETALATNKNNISKNAAELVELVDNGAKSLVDFPSIYPFAIRSSYTTITDGYTITGNASAGYPYMALPFTNFKAGNYVLKITVSAFTGADAAIFVKKGNYSIGTNIAFQMVTQTGDISIPFTLDTDSAEMGITIYPNQAATEAQQSISVSKLMICSKSAWDVSQKYVPYRPSYEETVEQVAENETNILTVADQTTKLTAAIQALQAQLGNTTIKIISKEEYDSIKHDENTVYYVKDGDKVVQYLGDAKFGTGSSSGSSSLYSVANKSVNGNAEFSEI